MNVLVIGASAAGLKAACRVRRLIPKANVTVLDEGEYISYAACGLPYYLSADIDDFIQLTKTAYDVLKTPEYFRDAKDVTVLTGHRAVRIDPDKKTVSCVKAASNENIDLSYDELILATGARAVIPDIPGVDLPGVYTFTRAEEAIQLREAANKNQIERVAIIGAGFIGCELCESFRALWGIETVLFEIEKQVLPKMLDPEVACIIEKELGRQEVDVHLGVRVTGIQSRDHKLQVGTDKDGSFDGFDRVIVAAGVTPRHELAEEACIRTGMTGGIVVDEGMRTNVPHIYAAGDCVETTNALTGQPCNLPLGSVANRMGRVAANVIAGKDDAFSPVTGAACLKVFDSNAASVGLTTKATAHAGFDAGESWGVFTDRAHYYPEAELISAKMVFDKRTQRILGVQAAGKGEVVRRIDVATLMIQQEMTLEQVRNFEPAYAPPYANALDPLHFLSYAGTASIEENVRSIPPLKAEEFAGRRVILDVREPVEVEHSPCTLPCSHLVAIPFTQVRGGIDALPRNKPLLVVCQRGTRSSEVVRILHENGFEDVLYLGGGLGFYES